jgi:Protein of unknown function (DUF1553)/Protein of unknown function (DUF1549)/Planctomycete cytochrome C
MRRARLTVDFFLTCIFCPAVWIMCAVVGLGGRVSAQEESLTQVDDSARHELARQAIALLEEKCFACHGPDKQEGSLRLDSREAVLAGGDRGPAFVVSADGEDEPESESLLLQSVRLTDPDLQMPPKKPLDELEVQLLERWLADGAHWPPAVDGATNANKSVFGDAWTDENNPIRRLFGGKRLDLWSLQPIVRPEIPSVVDSLWGSSPIDRFVLAHWERQGVLPVPESDLRVLGIRSSFDLIGMPPTLEEVQSLVHDAEPGAYDRWVDRLLMSPGHGVHLARMWLDVVRYSDSNGFDWDEFRPQAWRYRDYVVRALNDDLPFDEFVRQQLAGDELLSGAPRDRVEQDCLIATGYLRLGPHDNAAPLFNEQARSRAELLADLTETTASGFLGLTMSCCRCHDHKTEPLSQADHYRLRAFFAGVEFADEMPLGLEHEQQAINEHNAAIDSRVAELENEQRQIEEVVKKRIKANPPAEQPSSQAKSVATTSVEPESTANQNDAGLKASEEPSKQEAEISDEEMAKLFTPDEKARHDKLAASIAEIQETRKSHLHGLLMTDKSESVPPTYVLYQGDHQTQRESVDVGYPSVLYPNQPTMIQPRSASTLGRRLTLADWIASKQNPWTARVIVNRLWQVHFGRGLVETANDFGLSGSRPSHPELLDWLASELIHSGWSLKHIQRLIVTSRVYRLQPVAQTAASKGQGSMHVGMRRLSAEQLRDSMLAVSGLLQNRVGGTPVWPELDAEILQANPAFLDDNETKTKGWYPSPESEQTVRSIFLIQKRTVRIPWMETFDLPENSASCPRRESSIVAPQALSLMNGTWARQAAMALADRVNRMENNGELSDLEAKIVRCFQTAFQREPTATEREQCRIFLATRSLAELCLVLLNSNEFTFIE